MRNLRPVLLIVGFGIVPAIALYFAVSWAFGSEEPPPPPPEPVAQPAPPPKPATMVLIAGRSLSVGTLITAEDLVWKNWEGKSVKASHLVQGKVKERSILGSVVRTEIRKREPIVVASIVRPAQQGFLAAVLTPNYRAATIRVNRTTSHSGLLHPGDRVDVLFTLKKHATANSPGLTLTETILRGVRVVAVNRLVESIAPGISDSDPKAARSGKGGEGTITLEVLPDDAERLVLAQLEGTLSLTLRPMLAEGRGGSFDLAQESSPTVIGHLMPVLHQEPPVPEAKVRTVRILRGGGIKETVAFRE